MFLHFRLLPLWILLFYSVSLNAALHDRGNGMVYDDVLDVTWLQDASYASTSGYIGSVVPVPQNSPPSIVPGDYGMTWEDAMAWAEQLDYAGFTDWRLPSANSPLYPDDAGFDIISGELGYMYTSNLGNGSRGEISFDEEGGSVSSGTCDLRQETCLANTRFVDATTGKTISFLNLRSRYFWYADVYVSNPAMSWAYFMAQGQQLVLGQHNTVHAWAVRDGDVGQQEPINPDCEVVPPENNGEPEPGEPEPDVSVIPYQYRLYQESAPGADDFYKFPVGKTLRLVVGESKTTTVDELYRYSEETFSYGGTLETPRPIANTSQLFLTSTVDAPRALVILHDAIEDELNTGGNATVLIEEYTGPGAPFTLKVMDGTPEGEGDTYEENGTSVRLTNSWKSCCTDGAVIDVSSALLQADGAITISFEAIRKLDRWIALSPSGPEWNVIPLAFEPGRRLLIEAFTPKGAIEKVRTENEQIQIELKKKVKDLGSKTEIVKTVEKYNEGRNKSLEELSESLSDYGEEFAEQSCEAENDNHNNDEGAGEQDERLDDLDEGSTKGSTTKDDGKVLDELEKGEIEGEPDIRALLLQERELDRKLSQQILNYVQAEYAQLVKFVSAAGETANKANQAQAKKMSKLLSVAKREIDTARVLLEDYRDKLALAQEQAVDGDIRELLDIKAEFEGAIQRALATMSKTSHSVKQAIK